MLVLVRPEDDKYFYRADFDLAVSMNLHLMPCCGVWKGLSPVSSGRLMYVVRLNHVNDLTSQHLSHYRFHYRIPV
jgi:hypothetical protein